MRNKILVITGILIFFWFLYLFKVPESLSKFTSLVSSDANISIAFYVIDTEYQVEEIKLDKIVPSDTAYEYNFSVANYNKTKRLETNAEYNIVIRTTTNLNLEYELYENNSTDSAILSKELIQDEDGMYYNVIKTKKEQFGFKKNQINYYTLSIKFPLEYIDYDYQDMIESIEIIVLSKQVIE